MNVSRRTLYVVGGAVVLAIAIAGVVRFAFDDDSESDEATPTAANVAHAGGDSGPAPSAASAKDQASAEQEIEDTWTPEAIEGAFQNPSLPTVEPPPGTPAPSPSTPSNQPTPAPGGSEPPVIVNRAAGVAEARCQQPPKLDPYPGLPYVRTCYNAALGTRPSRWIGVLLSKTGTAKDGTVCSATVAASGPGGNRSVLVTAGHCVGIAKGDLDGDDPATRWIPNSDFLWFPWGQVKALWQHIHAYKAEQITRAQFDAWTHSAGWKPRFYSNGNWVGFADTRYMEGNASAFDFATVVLAPKGGETVEERFGGAGIDASGEAAGAVINSYGYPAERPFPGDQLFLCTGQSKIVGSEVQAGSAEIVIGCDMTGGSSGGPWMVRGTQSIVAVNSHGWRYTGTPPPDVPTRDKQPALMIGPHLNLDHWNIYVCAREVDTTQTTCKLG